MASRDVPASMAPAKNLSKNVMAMKFMQRQQEAALREKLKSDQEKLVKESQWVAGEGDGNGTDEASLAVVQADEESSLTLQLLERDSDTPLRGRCSFQNFNPQVEQAGRPQHSSASEAVNDVVSKAQPKLHEKQQAAAQRAAQRTPTAPHRGTGRPHHHQQHQHQHQHGRPHGHAHAQHQQQGGFGKGRKREHD